MRVISGSAKGHYLKGPPSRDTRPMSDKIRQALFSSLASLGVAPVRVLDLYAGTGSIGIETLSRGADWCDFVEKSPAAAAVIRANLDQTKLAELGHVFQVDVMTFIARARQAYDFIILDPPYADPHIVDTLGRIAQSPLVESASIVVIGHSPRVPLADQIESLVRIRHRCHGDSCFSIYEHDADAAVSTGEQHLPDQEGAL